MVGCGVLYTENSGSISSLPANICFSRRALLHRISLVTFGIFNQTKSVCTGSVGTGTSVKA
jgi:hypothetical protein